MRCWQCRWRQWLPQGWFAASQQGHWALLRGLLPGSTRAAALHSPRLAEKERVVEGLTKGKDAESQVRQLMGKKRCSGCYRPSSTPVFPYRLLPKPLPFPKGVMSIFLSQVNPFVFQVQLVSATTTVIFGAREHFPLHPALPQVF